MNFDKYFSAPLFPTRTPFGAAPNLSSQIPVPRMNPHRKRGFEQAFDYQAGARDDPDRTPPKHSRLLQVRPVSSLDFTAAQGAEDAVPDLEVDRRFCLVSEQMAIESGSVGKVIDTVEQVLKNTELMQSDLRAYVHGWKALARFVESRKLEGCDGAMVFYKGVQRLNQCLAVNNPAIPNAKRVDLKYQAKSLMFERRSTPLEFIRFAKLAKDGVLDPNVDRRDRPIYECVKRLGMITDLASVFHKRLRNTCPMPIVPLIAGSPAGKILQVLRMGGQVPVKLPIQALCHPAIDCIIDFQVDLKLMKLLVSHLPEHDAAVLFKAFAERVRRGMEGRGGRVAPQQIERTFSVLLFDCWTPPDFVGFVERCLQGGQGEWQRWLIERFDLPQAIAIAVKASAVPGASLFFNPPGYTSFDTLLASFALSADPGAGSTPAPVAPELTSRSTALVPLVVRATESPDPTYESLLASFAIFEQSLSGENVSHAGPSGVSQADCLAQSGIHEDIDVDGSNSSVYEDFDT